jgi:hypothetical protein
MPMSTEYRNWHRDKRDRMAVQFALPLRYRGRRMLVSASRKEALRRVRKLTSITPPGTALSLSSNVPRIPTRVVKSIAKTNQEALLGVIQLHNSGKRFDLDCTYFDRRLLRGRYSAPAEIPVRHCTSSRHHGPRRLQNAPARRCDDRLYRGGFAVSFRQTREEIAPARPHAGAHAPAARAPSTRSSQASRN